jgi:hypothetical protein
VKPSTPVESEPVEMLVAFDDSHLASDVSDVAPDSNVSELTERVLEDQDSDLLEEPGASEDFDGEGEVEVKDLGDVNEKE